MLTRRAAAQLLATTAVAAALGSRIATAAETVIRVGLDLSLTGADAESALRIKNGALMAFEEVNAKHEIPGYKLDVLTLDDGTATAGQYDPAQAATNARKMVSDKSVVAAIGPMMSGAGKAMAPILSQGDLACRVLRWLPIRVVGASFDVVNRLAIEFKRNPQFHQCLYLALSGDNAFPQTGNRTQMASADC